MNWKLSGWKTHLVVAAAVVVEGLKGLGYIDPDTARAVEGVLAFLGLSTVRAGIAKAEAAAKDVEAATRAADAAYGRKP